MTAKLAVPADWPLPAPLHHAW